MLLISLYFCNFDSASSVPVNRIFGLRFCEDAFLSRIYSVSNLVAGGSKQVFQNLYIVEGIYNGDQCFSFFDR